MIILQVHPNYLKVINSYAWFVYFIIDIGILYLNLDIVLTLILITVLLLIPIITIKKSLNYLMKTKLDIELKSLKQISFKSTFLENAYGVGTLYSNKKRLLKGLHIDDFKSLKHKMGT